MPNTPIYFYATSANLKVVTNAVFLIGGFCVCPLISRLPCFFGPFPSPRHLSSRIHSQILALKWSAEKTWKLLNQFEDLLMAYVDAAATNYGYGLPMISCFRAMEKAIALKWLNLDDFDYDEYVYYEQVENGDLNWIIPNRLLSFASPTQTYTEDEESVTHPPCMPFLC